MIDKDQVQILQFRDEILDGQHLEEKYKKKLPPIYRSFITVFSNEIGGNYLYSKVDDYVTEFLQYIYSDEVKEEYAESDDILSLIYFEHPEEVLRFGYEIDGWELDTMDIAKHGYGGGLKVGIEEHNLDYIYLEETKMANNIFEFLHKIIPIVNEDSFPNLDLDKIVKKINNANWEEI